MIMTYRKKTTSGRHIKYQPYQNNSKLAVHNYFMTSNYKIGLASNRTTMRLW